MTRKQDSKRITHTSPRTDFIAGFARQNGECVVDERRVCPWKGARRDLSKATMFVLRTVSRKLSLKVVPAGGRDTIYITRVIR